MKEGDSKAGQATQGSWLKRFIQRLRHALSPDRDDDGTQPPTEGRLSPEISPSASRPESRPAKIIYVDWRRETLRKPDEERPSHEAFGLVVMATAALVVATGYLAYFEMKAVDTIMTSATAASEAQTKTLPDGSVISLKPNSTVQLDAYESERRVHLSKGDAVFTAAPVANKPFVVSTLFARASTVGAMFRVALDRGMTVEVYDGEVDVAVPGMPAVTVKKGQRYRVIDERAGSVVAQAFVREPTLESIAREHRDEADQTSTWELT